MHKDWASRYVSSKVVHTLRIEEIPRRRQWEVGDMYGGGAVLLQDQDRLFHSSLVCCLFSLP